MTRRRTVPPLTWIQWVLIALFVSVCALDVAQIGLPRAPITPNDAASTVVIAVLLIISIVRFG